MQTMQPVIVFGSYMLDGENIPPDEFELRVLGTQAIMAEQGWSAVIGYGDAEGAAFVTYTTNYSPRNRPALGLVPAQGNPCLFVWASARDFKREAELAWMDDVRMAGNLNQSIGKWLEDAGISGGTVALVEGGNMRPPIFDAVRGSCAARGLATADADPRIQALLHAKRPRELVMIRRAAEILGATVTALHDSWKSGASASDAVLAAEGAAFANQAQDARTLFSLDGGRTLRPFERPSPDHPDRLSAYVAVRYQGYWAEGFVTLSQRSNKVQKAAGAILDKLIAAARPGTSGRDLAALADPPDGLKPHAMLGGSLGHGVGLNLTEPPLFSAQATDSMVANGVYALTVGLSQGRRNHAFTSALVAVGARGAEILWRAP